MMEQYIPDPIWCDLLYIRHASDLGDSYLFCTGRSTNSLCYKTPEHRRTKATLFRHVLRERIVSKCSKSPQLHIRAQYSRHCKTLKGDPVNTLLWARCTTKNSVQHELIRFWRCEVPPQWGSPVRQDVCIQSASSAVPRLLTDIERLVPGLSSLRRRSAICHAVSARTTNPNIEQIFRHINLPNILVGHTAFWNRKYAN